MEAAWRSTDSAGPQMLRGYITLALVGALMITADALQRIVLMPLAWVVPGIRRRVMSPWIRGLSWATMSLLKTAGGARFDIPATIPGAADVLVLMNHQSLLDIPVALRCFSYGSPLMVARRRWARGIPLVSHILRFFGHPLVDPGRFSRTNMERLARTARTVNNSLLIYPEGTRTRDGNIQRFRHSGSKALLGAKRWRVYLLVVDGLWETAKLPDFLRNVSKVHARVCSLGPFTAPDASSELDGFLEEMREKMCATLTAMRRLRPLEESLQ